MEAIINSIPLSIPVIIGALIIERLLPGTSAYSPMLFFKALGLGVSSKVHPKGRQSSAGQQQLAGILAIIIIVFPFVFLLFIMMQVVEFPYLFDALVLLICLNWKGVRHGAQSMCKAIDKNHTNLAKARLSPWVLRQTTKLSPIGLNKGAIEMLILRASKELFAVIFYYLCFGSLMVLSYRILTMLNQSWNGKITHFKHFGKPCQWLCYYLEWLPSRLLALTIMALNQFKLSFQLMAGARQWGNDNSLFLLAATAAALKVNLGGPVIYENNKIRRPVIGNQHTMQPQTLHVNRLLNLVDKAIVVWLLVIILIMLMVLSLYPQ